LRVYVPGVRLEATVHLKLTLPASSAVVLALKTCIESEDVRVMPQSAFGAVVA
jgi:hypothetical protein